MFFNLELKQPRTVLTNVSSLTKSAKIVVPPEENIECVNKSRHENTKDIFTSRHSGKRIEPNLISKPSTSRISHNNVKEKATGTRHSTRVKHARSTFWKVHKETIESYETKFYEKMIKNESSYQPKKANRKRKKSNRKRKNAREEIEKLQIEKYTNSCLLTQIAETEPEFCAGFTLKKPNTKERNKQDSPLQETIECDNQTNPHIKFLKKFWEVGLSDENVHGNQEIPNKFNDINLSKYLL